MEFDIEELPNDFTAQSSAGNFDEMEIEEVPFGPPTNVDEYKAQQGPIQATWAPVTKEQTFFEKIKSGFDTAVTYINRADEILSDKTTALGKAATIVASPFTRDTQAVGEALGRPAPEPTEPAAPAPQEDNSFMAGVKDTATTLLRAATIPPPQLAVEAVYELTQDPEKWNYIAQGAWQSSLTGSVVRGTFEREIERDIEERLDFKDKLLMYAGAMGPDLWLFGFGGMLPKVVKGGLALAPEGFRSLPIIQQTGQFLEGGLAQAMSSFGFFEGVRSIYYDMIMEDPENGKTNFIDMMGKALHQSLNGASMGALMKAGQVFRGGLMSNAATPWEGFAKTMGVLPAEVTAVTMLQAQLHSFGSLPTKEDFLLSAAMMFGFEGMTQFGMLKRGLHSNEILEKIGNVSKRNGLHPEALASLAKEDVTVIEDLNNPLRNGRIRTLEKEGTGQEPKHSEGVEEMLAMYNREGGKGEKAPTSDLVEFQPVPDEVPVGKQAMAQPGAAPAAPAPPPAPRIPLEQVPGKTHIQNPVGLLDGDPHDIMTLPDGREVAVPHDSMQSIPMSGQGLIQVPFFILKLKEFLDKGVRLESKTDKNDPVLAESVRKGGKTWGYYSHPALEKQELLADVDKRMKNANRAYAKAVKQDNADAITASETLLNELRVERQKIESTHYDQLPPRIVVNKEVAGGRPPRLIGTLLHEFGHAVAAANKGWRTGVSRANRDISMPGLSDSFWVAMSNYHTTVNDIWAWAIDQRNGVDPVQLRAEADLVSRLWRPISNADLLAKPKHAAYRATGAELVADIVSVSLHRPDLLQQYAPTLHRAMDTFLAGRESSAKEFFKGIQDDIAAGRDTDESLRLLNDMDTFDRQLDASKDSATSQGKLSSVASGVHKIAGSLFDDFHILWMTVKNLPASIHNAVQRFQYSASIKKSYHVQVNEQLVRPLQDMGLSNSEIAVLLSTKRIMHDPQRWDKFNSAFGDVNDANILYDRLIESKRLDHGRVEELLSNYHNVRQGTIIKLMEDSQLFGDDFLDTVRNNKWYVRFESMEHAAKAIEEGSFTRRGKRGQSAMTEGEAAQQAQTGTLGNYRNALAATLAYDNFLFDMVLRETALKKLITHSIETKDLPVFLAHQFGTVAKYTPELMQGYLKDQFRVVSMPTRVLVEETGMYTTIRQRYMVPAEVFQPFFEAPSTVKQFMSDVATLSMADLAKAAKEDKLKGGRWGLAAAAGIKGVMKVNGAFRSLVILYNMGFQVANFFVYDPVRSMVNMSGEIGWNALKMYPEMLKALPAAIKSSFGDTLDPRVLELYERGILTTKQEFLEQMGSTDLTDRLMVMYGAKGYRNRVQHKLQELPYVGIASISRALGHLNDIATGVANTTETASKLAADKMMREHSSLGQDARDVFVRTQAGSPAYGIKGQLTLLANTVFPFFNAIAQATRGDYRAWQANKKAVGVAMAAYAVPSIIQGLAAEGALDDVFDGVSDMLGMKRGASISTIMRTAGSAELSNNWVVPWGYNEAAGTGRRVSIPLSQNPAHKLIHSLTMNVVREAVKMTKEDPTDKQSQSFVAQMIELATDSMFGSVDAVLNAANSITPQLTPAYRIMDKGADLLRTGNFHNPYKGGMEFRQDKLDMDDKLKAMPGMVAKELGLPKTMRSLAGLVEPDPYETDELANQKFIEAMGYTPFFGDGFNRVFKSNNDGYRERNAKEEKRKAYDKARASEDVAKLLEAVSNGNDDRIASVTPKIMEHAEKGTITRSLIQRRVKQQNIKDIENIYLKRVAKDGTNESVDQILRLNGRDEAATEAYNFLFNRRK